jgi:hypothetical protein
MSLCIYVSMYLCRSVSLTLCLCVYLPLCLSVSLSILSLCRSVSMSLCSSASLPLCLSVSISLCLSIALSLWHVLSVHPCCVYKSMGRILSKSLSSFCSICRVLLSIQHILLWKHGSQRALYGLQHVRTDYYNNYVIYLAVSSKMI